MTPRVTPCAEPSLEQALGAHPAFPILSFRPLDPPQRSPFGRRMGLEDVAGPCAVPLGGRPLPINGSACSDDAICDFASETTACACQPPAVQLLDEVVRGAGG